MKSRTCIAVVIALLVPLVATGWIVSYAVTGNDAPPNVVLIVLDTTRQDRLSVYGHSRETTPHLEALAAESCLFLNAYATSSWTCASHASLFTGLYPVAHHCTQENWRLGDDQVTMAELLSAGGYQTVAIVENPMLSKNNHFDQGFDQHHEIWKTGPQEPGANTATTLSLFNSTLDERDESRPLFVFVNLNGPHSPYDSSGRFMDRFVTDPSCNLDRNMWREYYLGRKTCTPAELEHLRELYDAELLAVDDAVGKMVQALRQRGLLDDTILVITSDHGENIGDHEHMDHVFSLYETTIRIPLIIRYPSRFAPNSRREELVQLTDILPTVLAIAGLEPPGVRLQGLDLSGKQVDPDRPILCEYYRPMQARRAVRNAGEGLLDEKLRPYDRRLRTIIQNNVKLIWGSDGRHELYNLNLDPGELDNLVDRSAYTSARLRLLNVLEVAVARYARTPGEDSGEPNEPPDPETLRALRSLGYLD